MTPTSPSSKEGNSAFIIRVFCSSPMRAIFNNWKNVGKACTCTHIINKNSPWYHRPSIRRYIIHTLCIKTLHLRHAPWMWWGQPRVWRKIANVQSQGSRTCCWRWSSVPSVECRIVRAAPSSSRAPSSSPSPGAETPPASEFQWEGCPRAAQGWEVREGPPLPRAGSKEDKELVHWHEIIANTPKSSLPETKTFL